MSRQKKAARPQHSESRSAKKSWSSLTWDDIDKWAGSRSASRGRTYQRQGHVTDLVLAEDGRLLATVEGTRRYVTSAWLVSKSGRRSEIESVCTCPVGVSGCKHAVAVVSDFLAALAEKREVPVAEPDDRRWAKLSQDDEEAYDEFDGDDDELDDSDDDEWDDGDDEAEFVAPAKKRTKRSQHSTGKRLTRAEWDEKIRAHVEQKSREDLAGIVWSLVERFPELRQEFQERIALGEGDVDRLVAAARRELRKVTAEIGWQNPWQGDGHTPDYSALKHRLERLAELGHCDKVVELGRELISLGMEQVGESHDEGETATELSECLEVVFDALANSQLSPPDKILFVIDACLEDDYDVMGDAAAKILDAKWSTADWSVVADRLTNRLQKTPRGKSQDDFSRNYQRDCVTNFLCDALDRAGRSDELLAMYEAEARTTGSYQRLVSHLIEHERFEDAERWAHEGIEKTHEKLPGIASGLAKSLCEVARGRRQWDVVAAHAASEFLSSPSTRTFNELMAAAKKAKCQEPVRGAALRFLETGVPPIRVTAGGKDHGKAVVDPSWPLPVPEYLLPQMSPRPASSTPQPHFNVLLDMAIEDRRPDDVLRWYDRMTRHKDSKRGPHYGTSYIDSDRVAEAIAAAHPERALEIFQRKLDSYLRQTGTSAYETCAACLRAMRPIFKAIDQEDRWNELLADVRHNYRNRPRFMEILDKLEGGTIVESHRRSRRR